MKSRRIANCCALAIIGATGLYFSLEGISTQDPSKSTRNSARWELIDQIRTEASSNWIPPQAEPAPIHPGNHPEHENLSQTFEADLELDTPYTVVPAPVTMTKVKMAEGSSPHQLSEPEQSWLDAGRGISRLIEQAKKAERFRTYGLIQLAYPVDSTELEEAIRLQGGKLLSTNGRFLRVEVPGNRIQLERIADLPWVAGIGAIPPEEKVSKEFLAEINASAPSDIIPVFVTLMTDDVSGQWRLVLEHLHAEVGRFDRSIRVYEAVVSYRDLSIILSQDFVQSVEQIGFVLAAHDSAIPAMGVDALRRVGELAASYTGITGSGVAVGVVDTGLNTNHRAISSMRKSICGANFVDGEDHDLWVDEGLHGTHVTGTIAGNGFNQPKFAGMAPGIEHIRFSKVLNTTGFGSSSDIHRGMDFLATPSACPDAGWSATEVKPHIVNMSLLQRSLRWEGRSAGPRKLDSLVWGHRQLYVVANANSDIHGFSNYASAKNSLAVGAAYDSGDLRGSSSLGPTSDGRVIPHIVGTGFQVYSTAGNNSRDEYISLSGTSMSAPSVAGVAALLMSASPDHQEEPALVRARLLASAIKPDAWLDARDAFRPNNSNGPGYVQNQYGLGKVSARTSVLNRNVSTGWISGSAIAEISNEEYVYVDIEVPEGASRLDIVMTWDEPPTDTISRAVLNDLNLWIDQGADCESGPCGEHASTSSIDNLEWVIVSDPEPGNYRIKIVPQAVYTRPPRAAVAWTVIRGESAPHLSIETSQQVFESRGRHEHEIELWVSASSFVAAGTRLHVDCRTYEGKVCGRFYSKNDRTFDAWQHESLVDREDGIAVETAGDLHVSLGEVGDGERQRVVLNLTVEKQDQPVRVFFTATSWNGRSGYTSVEFVPARTTNQQIEEPETPTNDGFSTAAILMGGEGLVEIDTLLSTTEDGEPILHTSGRRPASSIWYAWTPLESEIAGFSVNITDGSWRDYAGSHQPHLDVFSGDQIAGLSRVASSTWSAQFFAERNVEYKVRVSHESASLPLLLSWFTGVRPVNDDFANAIEIDGESGTVGGTNVGATLESDELFGTLASSTWWRWTAPKDGIWRFRLEDSLNLVVLVFEGNHIDELRLVSGIQSKGKDATFPAGRNQQYYVMLASPDATIGGSKFDNLTWQEHVGSMDDGDLFVEAESLENDGTHWLYLGVNLTVEPNEPRETGIRTRWLKWQAGMTAAYTWSWDQKIIRTSVFTGETLDELRLVASGGGGSHLGELVLEATEGESYWLSFGYSIHEPRAFNSSGYAINLRWGLTPNNDSIGGAELLSGSSGEITGSTRFATTELDGLDQLGQDSLWYTIKSGESGWHKVWVDDPDSPLIVSVFRRIGGNGPLELISYSRSKRLDGEGTEVVFFFDPDSEYLIRVGSREPQDSISFMLKWVQTTPPMWLRYIGRIAEGWRDSTGRITSIGNPRDLEFDTSGRTLFSVSRRGLTLFERDPATGLLAVASQHGEIPPISYMLWDSHRSRLYVHSGCVWWTYTPAVDPALKRLHDVGGGCMYGIDDGSRALFMDPDGNFLYRRSSGNEPWRFAFDQAGNLTFNGPAIEELNDYVYNVLPNIAGSHWYVTRRNSSSIFVRQRGIGSFSEKSEPVPMSHLRSSVFLNDKYLFAYDRSSNPAIDVSVYELSDDFSAMGEKSSETFDDLNLRYCISAVTRAESRGIDILCHDGAFVVEYSPETSQLELQDYLMNEGSKLWHKRQVDRFGNLLPRFRIDHHEDPLEASPDGRHLYLTTEANGILIFERVGNAISDPVDLAASRYKRLDLIQVSSDRIEFGDHTVVGDCMDASGVQIDGANHSVTNSKWQQRVVGSEWQDVLDTRQSSQLCTLVPAGNREFRLVADIEIDGVQGKYASNFIGARLYPRLDELVVEPGKVDLDGLQITSCLAVSGVILNEKSYTVSSSSWQVRDDADSEWKDLSDSYVVGQLCPYDPTDDREYRLIGAFVIDELVGYHSSNVMKRAPENS